MMGFGLGGIGIVSMVFFWVVIIAAGVWLLGSAFPRRAASGPLGGAASREPDSPLDILQRRYAAGEISRDEYHVVRREIED